MGVIVDLWHLHRERILQAGGILLCAAAVALVLMDGGGADREGYETGRLLGTATRNVVLSVVVATLGLYCVRRFYWYEEDASWKRITPEALAIAGVLAVLLAVVMGAPETRAEQSREATLASIEDCGADSAAVTANLPPNTVELSTAEILAANPRLAASPPELRDAARMYVWRTSGVPFVLSTFPIPADRVGDASILAAYFEGFSDTMPQGQQDRVGITNLPIADRPAYEATIRGSDQQFIAVLDGCHVVTLQAKSVSTEAVLRQLLVGRPTPS